MFIPVGNQSQGEFTSEFFGVSTFFGSGVDIWQIDKLADGSVVREKLFGVKVRCDPDSIALTGSMCP